MPADAAKPYWLGIRVAIFQSLDQGERRGLRIGDHREPADVAVRRGYVDRAAETFELTDDAIDILDRDITHPSRRRPLLQPIERQLHKSRDRRPADAEKPVDKLGGGGVLDVPAHHLAVKGLRRRHVCRQQLVPGEYGGSLDHLNTPTAPMWQCTAICAPDHIHAGASRC